MRYKGTWYRHVSIFCAVLLLTGLSIGLADEKLTTLRTLEEAQGTFNTTRYGKYLTRAQVRIKNVGSVTANGVRVEVILPTGTRLQLSGPRSLKKYEVATYKNSMNEAYPPGERMEVEATCDNCRR